MMGVSIIMCCYNSEKLLPETLKHLAKLEIPIGYEVELILVDNCSEDETVAVATAIWEEVQSSFRLKVLVEEKRGQMNARKTGLAESQYPIVVFCDDDNWLDSSYLNEAIKAFDQHPLVGAIGGLGAGVSDDHLPGWFPANQSVYACGPQYHRQGICSRRGYLWGAGMAARKEVLESVFHVDHPMIIGGRVGKGLSSGDDVEISARILLCGYEIYYHPDMKFRHYLKPEKLREEYLKNLRAGVASASDLKRLYSYFIVKIQPPNTLFLIFWFWQFALYILLKMRLLKRQRRMIINPWKTYRQGISKKGKLHAEYQRIKAFANYAHRSI